MRGLSRRAVTGRENRGGTLGGRGQGLAARTIVAVELAAGVDGDADGRLRSHRLEVVPAILGSEDEVAGARGWGRARPRRTSRSRPGARSTTRRGADSA